MQDTLMLQFQKIIAYCFQLFQAKNADYGPTWLLYRYPSLNDEIWRKAKRIRTLEEHADVACIPEGRDVEYVGIINYCVMFLIKLGGAPGLPPNTDWSEQVSALDALDGELLYSAYQQQVEVIRQLLEKKNTDYGDAWRGMALCSMTDQVIIRTYRIRKILANNGNCLVSEGVAAQLQDIVNYCIFALIKMESPIAALG